MRMFLLFCALLLSWDVCAQIMITDDGRIFGIKEGEVVAYSGKTNDGECFAVTRLKHDERVSAYRTLYIGKCPGILSEEWRPMVRVMNNGTITFEFAFRRNERGENEADVLFVNGWTPEKSHFKKKRVTFFPVHR